MNVKVSQIWNGCFHIRKLTLILGLLGLLISNSYAQGNKKKSPYPQYHPRERQHVTVKNFQATPNIIVILTDDMGYGDISANGGPYSTPNIDQLASHGMLFTHYYSAAPICSPSRVGILTGMEPADWNFHSYQNTLKSNLAVKQADYLDPIAPSMARALKNAGYATAHIGKWHMGGGRNVYNAPKFALYGYDEHAGTYESPDPDPLITATNWIWSPEDSIKRWDRTAYFVNKTLDFLKRHKGTPCFVNLWPDDMHTPWVPNEEQQAIFPKNSWSESNFKKVLHEYDRQIGRLIDGLKKLGIYENTIVIFTSDNGPYPTFQGKRTGFVRGSKFSLYVGGTRMPFIVSWPGHVPAGQVDSTSIISALDIFPTIADIVGIQMPDRYAFDGESRKEVWLGNPSKRTKSLYWEYGSAGEEKAYIYPKKGNGYKTGDKGEVSRDRSPNLAIQQGIWKLLMNYDGSNLQLYNLKTDPGESNNIVDQHPDRVKELKEKLVLWRNNMPKARNNTTRY